MAKLYAEIAKMVSTHSRLKAAGCFKADKPKEEEVSTHSRLKAAGNGRRYSAETWHVSTHSRLKAAGVIRHNGVLKRLFQHTAA